MGYSIKSGLVEDNSPMLEVIRDAVEKGGEAYFPAPPDGLSGLQYFIRRILKAAEILTDECEGRFSTLGREVSVTMDPTTSRIVVKARHVRPSGTVVVNLPSEKDILIRAEQSGGTLFADYFTPSPAYSRDALIQSMSRFRWSVTAITPDPDDPSRLFIGAERPSSPSSFMSTILPKRSLGGQE